MAEGDNRARTDNATTTDVELAGKTVKADPVSKVRLPEDTSRSGFYAGATQKDRLPEHKARRDAYPLITAGP